MLSRVTYGFAIPLAGKKNGLRGFSDEIYTNIEIPQRECNAYEPTTPNSIRNCRARAIGRDWRRVNKYCGDTFARFKSPIRVTWVFIEIIYLIRREYFHRSFRRSLNKFNITANVSSCFIKFSRGFGVHFPYR